MLEFCPVCRARLKCSSSCRRCNADLKMPIRITQQADSCYLRSITLAGQGDIKAARDMAEQALRLKAQPLFRRWLAFLDKGPSL